MSWPELLPVLVLMTSLATGVCIFLLREERHRTRSVLNLTGAGLKVVLVGLMQRGVFVGQHFETRWPLAPGVDLVLRADALAMLFASLSAALWLLTTVYAIGYLEGSPHRSRFFGFFSLCVTATMGISLAGNPVTFLLFYEMLTLSTYPLVVHRGTPEALRAGRVYLVYTVAGGALVFVGVAWLHALAGPVEFTHGGMLADPGPGHRLPLVALFAVLLAGLAVKTALVPLHGWLPVAMVAPAPVTALLHAVAVVKAGAFGVVRVLYDVFGIELAATLGLTGPLAAVAATTILWGSVRALTQDSLKRRLAYSTVSQIAFIVLGVSLGSLSGSTGGLVHLVHQGLMKITLFFCAGNVAETLGIHAVSRMGGVARRMPWTMAAFTVGALGMIGTPPLPGFVTKWYLGLGALEAGQPWVLVVLGASTLLNAAYFLPIVRVAWFGESDRPWEPPAPRERQEAHPLLLAPTLAAGALALAVGLLAGSPASPLSWARGIATLELHP